MVEMVPGGLPRPSKELLSRGLLAPTQIQLAAKVLVGWRPRQYAYQKSTWLQFLMSLCLTLSKSCHTQSCGTHGNIKAKQEINILSNQCSLYQCMHLYIYIIILYIYTLYTHQSCSVTSLTLANWIPFEFVDFCRAIHRSKKSSLEAMTNVSVRNVLRVLWLRCKIFSSLEPKQ